MKYLKCFEDIIITNWGNSIEVDGVAKNKKDLQNVFTSLENILNPKEISIFCQETNSINTYYPNGNIKQVKIIPYKGK